MFPCMATVQRFEDLKVWQQAREVAKQIYRFAQLGSFAKDYELKNQISRSSGSVMDNIAEGFGRGSRTEFIQFLGYSLGSNDEVKSQLYRALDRGHFNPNQFSELYAQVDVVARMIISFMNYLKKTAYRGFKYNTSGVEEPLDDIYEAQRQITNPEPQTNYKHQTINLEPEGL